MTNQQLLERLARLDGKLDRNARTLEAARADLRARRAAKGAVVGLALLTASCAGSMNMSRVASGLEAAKHLHKTACEPTPVDERVCAEAFDGINSLVDAYTALNSALPEN